MFQVILTFQSNQFFFKEKSWKKRAISIKLEPKTPTKLNNSEMTMQTANSTSNESLVQYEQKYYEPPGYSYQNQSHQSLHHHPQFESLPSHLVEHDFNQMVFYNNEPKSNNMDFYYIPENMILCNPYHTSSVQPQPLTTLPSFHTFLE